jgi:IS30 family transposase
MAYTHLTPYERGQIQALLESGVSKSEIARRLGRSKSTVTREVNRNSSRTRYRAETAQRLYAERREECRPARKVEYLPLWRHLIDKIGDKHPPEAVAGRLPLDYPDDLRMRISHEAIYQAIYGDKRLHFLIEHLPQARPRRRKRGQGKTRRWSSIPNRTGIEERPKEVDARTRFGDWEGDLVVGTGQRGFIVTLVERKNRMLLSRKINSKNAETTAKAVIDAFMDVPRSWVKTITFDNGSEFANHEKIAAATGADTYFADPYASYQRGTNENTNGLIRRFLPKNTCFEKLTQEQLDQIVENLNDRPRKVLGYRTPNEVFFTERKRRAVALTP